MVVVAINAVPTLSVPEWASVLLSEPSVRKNFKSNKSMCQKYTNMFLDIAEYLKLKLAFAEKVLSVS
jgi:hypothetical protein